MADAAELLELVAMLAQALSVVEDEMEALTTDPIEVPLDEGVTRDLRQRDAFVETFRRLNDSAKVTKAQLRKVFEEEFARTDRAEHSEVSIPMLAETREVLDLARELLRRRGLFDGDVHEALRPLEFGGYRW
jgi:hypothetical protein